MVDENSIFLRLLCYKATQNRGHSFLTIQINGADSFSFVTRHVRNTLNKLPRGRYTCINYWVVGGFIFQLCSFLFGEMIQFDKHMFQMGRFNHHLGKWSNLTSICSKWVGSTTIWGNDPIWQAYFPNGLKPPFGAMIQFDKHMFQMGWFNHHLGKWSNLTSICSKWVGSTTNYRLCYLLSISITHQKTIQHKLNWMEPGIEIWKKHSKRHNLCLPGTLNNHCFNGWKWWNTHSSCKDLE